MRVFGLVEWARKENRGGIKDGETAIELAICGVVFKRLWDRLSMESECTGRIALLSYLLEPLQRILRQVVLPNVLRKVLDESGIESLKVFSTCSLRHVFYQIPTQTKCTNAISNRCMLTWVGESVNLGFSGTVGFGLTVR